MKKQKSKLLGLFSEAIRKNWEREAFTDFGGESQSYRQVAERIVDLHQIFKEAKIAKGDKIALLGNNSCDWSISFIGIMTYGAVVVPILPDFFGRKYPSHHQSFRLQNIVGLASHFRAY